MVIVFGPTHIDFDEYPRYSGRTSTISEKTGDECIQCDHGYAYSSGKNNCAHGLIRKVGKWWRPVSLTQRK